MSALQEQNLHDVIAAYMRNEEVSHTPTEAHMQQVLHRYLEYLNQQDAAAIRSLFADNARVEDPVGAAPIVGLDAIATFQESGLRAMRKAELVAPIRTSPGSSAAMAFDIHMDFGGQEVIIHVVDVMKFDEAGKIVDQKAYWGQGDVEIVKGEMQDFLALFLEQKQASNAPTEAHMRSVMQRYLDNINNKDADAVLALFADTIVGEDPIGTKPIVGLENLAPFIKQNSASRVELVAPIRTSFANSAAMAFDIYIDFGGQEFVIQALDVMTFDEAGKIVDARAHWGKDNVLAIQKGGAFNE
jgi:ketosteroid isomerase-like protein